MKVIISESQYNRLIDNFITFLLDPHQVETFSDFPDSVFWIKDGKVIAEIENDDFYLSYITWDKISEQFGLESYNELQFILKSWLEHHYGLGHLTPDKSRARVTLRWDLIFD